MTRKTRKGNRKTHEAIREEGRAAFRERVRRQACPYHDYPRRSARNAWLGGWDDEARESRVQTMRPRVVAQTPRPQRRGDFWPEDRPMPTVYLKQRLPCPECKRLRDNYGRQAVKVKGSGRIGGVAYFECRHCGHRWQLPVVDPHGGEPEAEAEEPLAEEGAPDPSSSNE